MKKRIWIVRGLAAGIALMICSAGMAVYAESPKELGEAIKISEEEYKAVKTGGEITSEEKRDFVEQALCKAAVPDFMIEKIDDGTIQTIYEMSQFEIQTQCYKECPNGKLEPISREQNERIEQYNQQLEKKKFSSLSEVSVLSAQGNALSGTGQGISSMTHLLLVGAPDENQVRWFIALAGWKTPPLMRMKDFIGVISNHATTNDASVVARRCFNSTNLNTAETQEMEDEFNVSTAQFIKSIFL